MSGICAYRRPAYDEERGEIFDDELEAIERDACHHIEEISKACQKLKEINRIYGTVKPFSPMGDNNE